MAHDTMLKGNMAVKTYKNNCTAFDVILDNVH